MRRWLLVIASLALGLGLTAGPARAHFGKMPYYPGATPKALCYVIKDMGPLWQAWIENAAANWNQAGTGWTFVPCPEGEANPDIVFRFNPGPPKIAGGAQGGPRGGGAVGAWEIIVEPDVSGMDINGKVVKGGVDGKGWRMENQAGEQTLDPVLVLGHELGHALGLDHGKGCDTGNLEEPVCAGNHGNPTGRKPSANDIAEVKKGIAIQQQKEAEAREKAAKEAGGDSDKHNAPSALESAVLRQVNAARADPRAYADTLRSGARTPATQEAIGFLERQAPLPPIAFSPRLGEAAVAFALDAGPRGGLGHAGADGSTPAQRMQRRGVFSTAFAEEVSLGEAAAAGVVRQLVVDEASPSRSHRADLFDPRLRLGGVGCRPHKTFRMMCVIDLAAPPPAP